MIIQLHSRCLLGIKQLKELDSFDFNGQNTKVLYHLRIGLERTSFGVAWQTGLSRLCLPYPNRSSDWWIKLWITLMALACAIPGFPYPRRLLPSIVSEACTGSCASCVLRRCWHCLLQIHLPSGVPACSNGSRSLLGYPTSPELFV